VSRADLLEVARGVARAAHDGEQVEAYVVRRVWASTPNEFASAASASASP